MDEEGDDEKEDEDEVREEKEEEEEEGMERRVGVVELKSLQISLYSKYH